MADASIPEDKVAQQRAKMAANKRAWVVRNRDKHNAYHRDRRAKSNGKRREYERLWEEKNRERINDGKRRRRAANIEKAREEWRQQAAKKRAELRATGIKRDRSWEKENPDKVRAGVRQAKAKRKGAAGKFTANDIAMIRKAQRDKCAYCRCKLNGEGHIDHIIAVAKGGTNYPNNLQLACSMCNSRKAAKDPIVFAQEMGLLV